VILCFMVILRLYFQHRWVPRRVLRIGQVKCNSAGAKSIHATSVAAPNISLEVIG